MTACVVRADIAGKIARAFGPRALLFRRVQLFAYRLFVIADPHTTAAVRSERRKFISLGAGLEGHSVRGGDFNHLFAEREPLFLCDFTRLGKVALDLRVQV